jgi:hypothetical protein
MDTGTRYQTGHGTKRTTGSAAMLQALTELLPARSKLASSRAGAHVIFRE